jgi:ribosomal protein S18 acetylase RimI-like enzyme
MHITELKIEDYDALIDLMTVTPEMKIREADSREAVTRYLRRNPGLSFAAWEEGKLVGCALCGHDGRRGYLQHVTVAVPHRGQGIAHQLVTHCLDGLEKLGISKTHLDVFITNDRANSYWRRRGWQKRDDIHRYSFNRSENPDA